MNPQAYVSPVTRPPTVLPVRTVARAKNYMRSGLDLDATALALSVRRADLDVSLWRYLGSEG